MNYIKFLIIFMLNTTLLNAAVIVDSTTNTSLKTVVDDEQRVTIYICQKSVNLESLELDIKCGVKPLGNRSYSKDEIEEKFEGYEKNDSIRFWTNVTLTTLFIVDRGLFIRNWNKDLSSHSLLRQSFVIGVTKAGLIGAGLGYTFTEILFGSDIENRVGDDEELIELKSGTTVEDFIYIFSDNML